MLDDTANEPVYFGTMKNVTKNAAKVVRQHVLSSGMTFQSLADRMGVDLSTVSKKLSGHRSFSVNDLVTVRDFLNEPDALKGAGRRRKLSLEELIGTSPA